MLPVESLTTFLLASFLLGLAPGPDNIFVFTQSALYGRMAGIMVTLGLCTGLLVHTAVVAGGVAVLFQTSNVAFTLLKLVGVSYLLYLAWQALSASEVSLQGEGRVELTALQLYRRGVIMNVTNPKVSIFFLAFLPQFIVPEHGAVVYQIVILGALFVLTTLILFCGIALLAGTLGSWVSRTPKFQLYLNYIAAAVFVALAVNLAIAEWVVL